MSTETSPPLVDLHELLLPISAESPSGDYLLYEGTYKAIRQARLSEEDDSPRGVWTRDLKVSDWAQVRGLCTAALLDSTKDLQIAAWLTEAWFHLEGAVGLARGVDLVLSLSESFWETVHPGLADGIEFRAAPFFWMNEKFPDILSALIVADPIGEPERQVQWGDWKRALWLESLRQRRPDDDEIKQEYERALTVADAMRAADQTAPETLYDLAHSLNAAVDSTRRLETFLDDRMGPDSPSLVRFREAIEEIRAWADGRVSGLQQAELDTIEADSAAESARQASSGNRAGQGVITSRAEAYARLIEAARYLKEVEPHSPTPYLVMRAVAWGDKSLDELLREFVQQGLNLEALFIFLGIEGPER